MVKTPLMHRILLKPRIETTSKGGIIIAVDEDQAAVHCDIGEVLAIGDKAFKDFNYAEPPVKVGDTVYYARYGARVIKFDDDPQKYIICNDEDIIIRLEKE